MSAIRRLGIASSLLCMAAMPLDISAQTPGSTPAPPLPGRVTAPPLEGPTTDLEPIPADDAPRDGAAAPETDVPATTHDALQAPATGPRAARVYAPHQPPGPITERPSGRRPGGRAQWVPGYWEWDPVATEFVWMGGVWQVPPPGMIWVASHWARDGAGWYRVAGKWGPRRDAAVVRNALSPPRPPAWRTTGPPADHPADTLAAAPGPDYFFVTGHYVPAGDQLKWKPGFWATVQPGWDWIPARWVRRPAGWEFRGGHWLPETGTVDVNVTVGGRTAARVVTPGAAPVAGESNPATSNAGQPPPPGNEDERDVIAEAEERLPVVVAPRVGMPYYVIRPPGLYPYGPGGVVVPGVVPPFVRRILDQVLP